MRSRQCLPNFVLIAAALFLTGCGPTVPKVVTQQVKVIVPVSCQEPEPERPVMPTEHLGADPGVYVYVQAAGAEIERREGYEELLRAALRNCKRPLPELGPEN